MRPLQEDIYYLSTCQRMKKGQIGRDNKSSISTPISVSLTLLASSVAATDLSNVAVINRRESRPGAFASDVQKEG